MASTIDAHLAFFPIAHAAEELERRFNVHHQAFHEHFNIWAQKQEEFMAWQADFIAQLKSDVSLTYSSLEQPEAMLDTSRPCSRVKQREAMPDTSRPCSYVEQLEATLDTEKFEACDTEKAAQWVSCRSHGSPNQSGTLVNVTSRLQGSGIYDCRQVDRSESMLHLATPKVVTVVTSVKFEAACAVIIMINAALIAIETEYVAYHMETLIGLTVAQHVINGWFAVELFLRMHVSGFKHWWTSKEDRLWNMFDLFLVLLWPGDLITSSMNSTGLTMTRLFRVFRQIRLLRTIRVFRMMRSVVVFRKMVVALSCSFYALMWSLVLLVFDMLFFVTLFTQGVTDFRRDVGSHRATVKPLTGAFGTLEAGLYSLYKAISNGESWGSLVEPMFSMTFGWVYVGLFTLFIFITFFGVMNVLTAVFVESALESAAIQRDVLVYEKQRQKAIYAQHLSRLFEEIDFEHSGMISLREIERLFDDPNVNGVLDALEIHANDARALFNLLDADKSGSVDVQEFIDGCLRLQGAAKAFDINCLMHENQRLIRKTTDLMCGIESHVTKLLGTMQRSHSEVTAQVRSIQSYMTYAHEIPIAI